MTSICLSRFDNSWYQPGGSRFSRALWFFAGLPLVRSPLMPLSTVRAQVLRIFGAKIGHGVVIKPGVRIKYPWRLRVGNHSWIGEDCWIDNVADVDIGSNVCLSQGSYVCTGNHDWSDIAFGLRPQQVQIKDGAWIGAQAKIAPGVTVCEGAVVAPGSVVHHHVPAYEIHSGNPAQFIRRRIVRKENTSAVAASFSRRNSPPCAYFF
jgi:putative colanic acid biosynthesis acetyltransferase WcaF